jgi:manganese transport protein
MNFGRRLRMADLVGRHRGSWIVRTADRPSLSEVNASVRVPLGGSWFRRLLAFSGPGYMVSVGYMDPGNWATDIAGGAQFGYTLLSVIMLSNLMAILLQALAARLGIATGRDLAQACRDAYSPPVNFALWVGCEIAIIACDLAEVIGTAIALQLLFGIPLLAGVLLTALDAFLLLMLMDRGFRYLEAFVIAMLVIIALCFGVQIALAAPPVAAVLSGFIPSAEIVSNPAMLYIAIGIIGATVMPHNLYLHSSIVQTRAYPRTDEGKRSAIRFAVADSTTWLSTSSSAVPRSPYSMVTATTGTIARPRVISRRRIGRSRSRKKPSMTICPASVPVTVELTPEASSATANTTEAMPTPSSGDSRR